MDARVGSEGTAPLAPAARAPAALPRRRASTRPAPSDRAVAKPPQNASPAATVSTASTSKAPIADVPSASAQATPWSPRVITTAVAPRRRRLAAHALASSAVPTGMPVSRAASCSLGTSRSTSARIIGSSSRAGAGFRMVSAPRNLPARMAAPTASGGTSCWASTTVT